MKGAKGNDRIAAMLAAPGMPHLGGTLAAVLFWHGQPSSSRSCSPWCSMWTQHGGLPGLQCHGSGGADFQHHLAVQRLFQRGGPSGFPCRWPSTWAPGARRTPSVSLGRPAVCGDLRGDDGGSRVCAVLLSAAMLGLIPRSAGTPPFTSASWPAPCPSPWGAICSVR